MLKARDDPGSGAFARLRIPHASPKSSGSIAFVACPRSLRYRGLRAELCNGLSVPRRPAVSSILGVIWKVPDLVMHGPTPCSRLLRRSVVGSVADLALTCRHLRDPARTPVRRHHHCAGDWAATCIQKQSVPDPCGDLSNQRPHHERAADHPQPNATFSRHLHFHHVCFRLALHWLADGHAKWGLRESL